MWTVHLYTLLLVTCPADAKASTDCHPMQVSGLVSRQACVLAGRAADAYLAELGRRLQLQGHRMPDGLTRWTCIKEPETRGA